jgi:branched-chain amino acid transport system permease protein
MAAMTTTSSDLSAEDPRVAWRPSSGGIVARGLVLALIVAVVVWIPHLLDATRVNVYSTAIVFSIIALSMNILIGYAGQVSLGHQAFVGVGSFLSAYFLSQSGLPWILALVATIVLGALISLGLGAVSLRVAGLYFALVTIAYGVFVQFTIFGIPGFTGGGAGAVAPRPQFATGDIAYAYVCLIGLVLAWVFDWRLTASRAGRAIQALRDDERVAAGWGINVKGYKLLAFALSGGMAALAGALFASIQGRVSPLDFDLQLALTFVIMTVVGGLRSRPGVVIGGFLFSVMPNLLQAAHQAWGENAAAMCTTPASRATQFTIGLAIAGMIGLAIVRSFRTRGISTASIAATLVGAPIALAMVMGLVVGAVTGNTCMWGTVDGTWATVVGPILLIVVLTSYPGGLAQVLAPVLRWLSFQRFETPSSESSSGGVAGGSSSARP